ncbi:hypothetical protein IX332_001184 [Porphyromonas levii]|nr:hypothetical protein [Porphyromonas levii]
MCHNSTKRELDNFICFMTIKSEYNQKIKRRLYALLVAKKVGALKDVEIVELRQLLKEFPEMQPIHDKFIEDESISMQYRLWRETRWSSKEGRSLASKVSWQFRFLEQSKIWRPVAAVLFPALLLMGGWLLWRHDVPDDVNEPKKVIYASLDSTKWLESVILSEVEQSGIPDVAGSVSRDHLEEGKTYEVEDSGHRKQFSSDEKEFLVVLEDGTEMHLGYNTVLTYPPRFNGPTREVTLKGEAYVKVAKESRPFIIHTTNGKIKQFGTTFYVCAKAEDTSTEVVLIEGSVGIQRKSSTSSEMTMLNPKDRAIFGDAGSIFIESIDLLPYTSWDAGSILFDKMPLVRLMNVLSLWYDVKVSFADTITSQKTVSGSLSRKSGITDVLQALSATSDIEMELKDGVILVGRSK